MICEFCEYEHDNEGDRFGCPNCEGKELDDMLFHILDGIVSSDYTTETMADVESVIAYAEASGEVITEAQAQKIIEVGKAWLNDQENGNGEWSRMRGEAKKALSE